MRIVFLSDDFPPESFGGAGIVAFEQAKGLRASGHEVSVITTTKDRTTAGELTYEGLRVFRIYSSYPERWRSWRGLYNSHAISQLRGLLRRLKPDVVHAHNVHYHLSYYSLKVARQLAPKVFLTAHDAMLVHYGKLGDCKEKLLPWKQMKEYRFRYNPLRNLAIRALLKNVTTIFAVSDALREALTVNGLANVTTLHNGIQAESWQVTEREGESAKARFGIAGRPSLLVAGRLSRAKGGMAALQALAALQHRIPEAVLIIAGKREHFSVEFEGEAKRLGVEESLVFTGWLDRSEMKSAYAAADVVLVLSCYCDPFPTVNLEAQAAARPVIGTNCGGTMEAVIDGKTGYIVDPRDIATIADKAALLLSDRELYEHFSQNASRRAREVLSLAEQIKTLLGWYGA